MAKTIYLENTEIAAEKTAGEITALLVSAGAAKIQTDYDKGKIVGLTWSMKAHDLLLTYKMPVRVDPVLKLLGNRLPMQVGTEKLRAKAERIAWRQLFRWIQAQLAMTECGMAEARQVFLPYMVNTQNQTVYELFEGSKFKMLEAPKQ